jgi:hypothetical protein
MRASTNGSILRTFEKLYCSGLVSGMALGSDGAYGAGDVLSEGGVRLVRAHIE